MNHNTILWLDLDGVHVDLDKHLKDKYDFEFPKEKSAENKIIVDGLWEMIHRTSDDFWLTAPKTEYFDELFDSYFATGFKMNVLSATPATYDATQSAKCAVQKRKWVEKNMHAYMPACITKSKIKQDYIEKFNNLFGEHRHILIDDHVENIKRWETAGGIGILHDHSDYKETIKQLMELK